MTHSFPTRRSSDLFRFRRPYPLFSAPVGIPQEESPHPLANKSASLAASPSRGRECAAPAPQTSKQEHHRRGKEDRETLQEQPHVAAARQQGLRRATLFGDRAAQRALPVGRHAHPRDHELRSEEHTSELQS